MEARAPVRILIDDEARMFLASARTGTLATIRPDGRPRLVPICFVLGDDDPTGRPRLYTPIDEKPKRAHEPGELARVRDIIARPDVEILVDRWDEDWTRLGWLRCKGTATPLDSTSDADAPADERSRAIASLRTKYPQYADHRLEKRPLIRITIASSSRWGALG